MSSKQPVARSRRRVSLTLDAAILPERVILRRFDALPRGSGRDWLRSLLTQGLLVEGRWHQGEEAPPIRQGDAFQRPTSSDAVELTINAPPQAPAISPMTEPGQLSDSAKPFARLRQVIG